MNLVRRFFGYRSVEAEDTEQRRYTRGWEGAILPDGGNSDMLDHLTPVVHHQGPSLLS